MNREHVLTNSRLGGQLRRYHSWPMIQSQTVADHTYNCMRIWWQVFGPLPPHITSYFLWHDTGELVSGDLPFPVKANNGTLKAIMDEIEHGAVRGMDGVVVKLEGVEKVRAKACDLIEMWEHGTMEMLLGNKFGEPIVDDTYKALEALPLTMEDGNAIFKYLARWGELCT